MSTLKKQINITDKNGGKPGNFNVAFNKDCIIIKNKSSDIQSIAKKTKPVYIFEIGDHYYIINTEL